MKAITNQNGGEIEPAIRRKVSNFWFHVALAAAVAVGCSKAGVVFADEAGPGPAQLALPAPLSFSLSATPNFVREDGREMAARLDLSSAAPGRMTVRYYTTNRTAQAGADFEAVEGVVTFSPGDTVGHIPIAILDDLKAEGDEVFGIVLADWTGGSPNGASELLVAIRDDEYPVVRDPTFEQTIPPDGEIQALALQPDGKLLITGSFFSVDGFPCRSIARLNPDGSVDRTFNPHINRGIDGPIRDLRLLPDGAILIVGDFRMVQGNLVDNNNFSGYPNVARLRPDGSFDRGFKTYGVPSNEIELEVLGDGKILMAGGPRFGGPQMGRYFADGTPDQSFRMLGSVNGIAFVAVGVLSDGRIIAGGEFLQVGDVTQSGLVRISTNAVVDRSFAVQFSPRGGRIKVEALAVQPDDRIVIAGVFEGVNGVRRPGFTRLNPDGSLDQSFDPMSGMPADFSNTRQLLLSPSGDIYWVGQGTPLAPDRRTGVLRFDSHGRLDAMFNPASDAPMKGFGANAAAVQSDGKVIIAGDGIERVFPDSSGLRGIGFAPGATNALVEGNSVEVVLERYGDVDQTEVRAILTTQSGTATVPDDVELLRTNIVIGAGSRATGAVVRTLGDGKAELTETFAIVLEEDGPGGVVVHPRRIEVSIAEGDAPSVVDLGFRAERPGSGPILLQPDGKILLASLTAYATGVETINVVWRLKPDGSTDSDFLQTPVSGWIGGMALDQEGRLLLATHPGHNLNGVSLTRFRPDGSLDTEFKAAKFYATFRALFALPAGKALVATSEGVLLLNEDGSRDNSVPLWDQVRPTAFQLQDDGMALFHHDEAGIFDFVTLQRRSLDGTLDPTFSLPLASTQDSRGDQVEFLAIGSEGEAVFAGGFTTLDHVRFPGLAKIGSNGSLDPDFRPELGSAQRSWWQIEPWFEPKPIVRGVWIQPDGKILVTSYRFGLLTYPIEGPIPADSLIRLNPDGTADLDFQFDRYFKGERAIGGVAIQPDGKILALVGGQLIRLFGGSHSAPRIGFSTNEFTVGEPEQRGAVLVRREGDVTGAATVNLRATSGSASEHEDFPPFSATVAFAPYEREKTIFLELHDDPFAEIDETISVTLTASANNEVNLDSTHLRLVDDDRPGSLDFGFSASLEINPAAGFPSIAQAMVLSDGTIVVETARSFGSEWSFVQPDGSLISKSGFVGLGTAGPSDGEGIWVWIQSGQERHLRELKPGGISGRTVATPLPDWPSDVSVLPLGDSGLLVFDLLARKGAYRNLERLTFEGTWDRTFNVNLVPPDSRVRAAVLDHEDRILIGGTFTNINGMTRQAITRLLSDGTLDAAFLAAPGFEGFNYNGVRALAVQADGRILAGGRFQSFNGHARKSIARLQPDGALDLDYDPGRLLAETEPKFQTVRQIAVLPDGKALVLLGSDEETTFQRIVRLTEEGALDGIIFSSARTDGYVTGFTLQGAADILVWGGFKHVNGIARPGLARIHLETPLRIHTVDFSVAQGVSLVASVNAGQQYVLETSRDLRQWTPIQTNLAIQSRLRFEERGGLGNDSCFYRVRRDEPPR